MKAIILSAGQGKRLGPITESIPKALLDIAGQELLAWQIGNLSHAGIDEIVIVTGYKAELIQDALNRLQSGYPGCTLSEIINPSFDTTENLVSCWAARDEMTSDFLLVNGDTLFESSIIKSLLTSPIAPVTLAVDHKPQYDEDDMKVSLADSRLTDVGKTIPHDKTDGEAIGVSLFRGDGPELFRQALEEAMQWKDVAQQWYLSVIRQLAQNQEVQTQLIDGLAWQEIDYPDDLARALHLAERWKHSDTSLVESASTI